MDEKRVVGGEGRIIEREGWMILIGAGFGIFVLRLVGESWVWVWRVMGRSRRGFGRVGSSVDVSGWIMDFVYG